MKRLFTSGSGILLFYALVCGGIYLLQAFPATGVILMFFGAMLWIGIAIHVAMAHLAIASLTKIISRAWLAVPIVYYVGGYALHLVSVRQVQEKIGEIERANAAVVIKVEQPFSFVSEGSPDTFELLERYRADRSFILQGSGTQAAVTARYYAKGEACDSANTVWFYEKRREPFLMRRDLFASYKGGDKTRQCILSQDGLAGDWRYRIKGEYINEREAALYRHFGSRWTVSDDRTGAKLVSVEVGGFNPLPPIQTVFAGCALNSGAARWDCAAGLMREGAFIPVGFKKRTDGGNNFIPTNDPDTWEITVLARALSLDLRQPTD